MAQAALDVIDEWEASCGLAMGGIDSAEKAVNTVKAAMLFIDAGYEGPTFLSDALLELNNEYAGLLHEEGNDEIREILGDAIEALEQRISQTEGKEKDEEGIVRRFDEAMEMLRTKELRQVGAADVHLTRILMEPGYKRYLSKHPEERERILAWRDRIRAVNKSIKSGGDIAQIDALLSELIHSFI
jgi:hypothetical protein